MTRAPLSARITSRINALVWRAPLPQRLQNLISGVVYRNPPTSAERAVETLAALEQAQVRACCMGGWGIDALVGKQSRKHRDLDLIVERRDWATALRILAKLGYEIWYEQSSDQLLGDRVVVRDRAMRVVDVHPVDLDETEMEIVSGTIAGRPVHCLSAEAQIRAHEGFQNRLPHERRSQRSNTAIAQRVLEIESSSPD